MRETETKKGIEILEGGILTTIQDSGRFGYQQFGMPTAGAVDEFSYRVGNLLVQNRQDAPALEATLKGPKLYFHESAVIAITGAVTSPRLEGKSVSLNVPMWESFYVEEGSTLSLGDIKEGCRIYIAAAGGFEIPPVMGSCSTYLRGALGGFKGRKLQKKDILPIASPAGRDQNTWNAEKLIYEGSYKARLCRPHQAVRVVLGPQDDYFTARAVKTFLGSEYTLSNQSDRMGCRLEGPLLQHRDSSEIISDGMPHGAVQVPGHGHPIIMLSDRPTTGGYPKIATVISADLPGVAQLKSGEKISFQEVTLEEAQKIRKDFEKEIYNSLQKKEIPYNKDEYLKYEVSVDNRSFLVKIKKL